MKPGFFDYHTHTPWCRHAEGPLEAYVEAARERGLSEIGISDHLPWPADQHPSWTMSRAEFPAYVAQVRALQKRPGDPRILLAAEADYYKGQVAATRDLINAVKLDYVIGSVHVIGDWGIDGEEQIDEWKKRDVDGVWREYFQALRESAACGLFHIIGHCDVAKKFNYRPKSDMTAEMKATAEAFATHKVLAEINTSGLRKPCAEIYPSPAFLAQLRAAGVGIVLGSDAHKPGDVARDFDLGLKLARSAGYDTLHRWAGPGEFEPVPIKLFE
ncbi:MAG: histidinol-phosphatase HisJ family protein [candidate division FCPU426 bacterium]